MNIPNAVRDSPLYVACDKGMEDMVDLLLQQPGIKLDAGKKNLPLHAAARKGFFRIAQKLLLAGAKVNVVRKCPLVKPKRKTFANCYFCQNLMAFTLCQGSLDKHKRNRYQL